MTAFLFVLVPVALFGLIATFCFVGCLGSPFTTAPGNGENPPPPPPFTKYSDDDVIGNMDCVAYWPLSEAVAQNKDNTPATAADVVGRKKNPPDAHDGTYLNSTNQVTTPTPNLYPYPKFTQGSQTSAGATGDMMLGVTGLVKGDAVQPGNDPNVITTAMQTDGGCVVVAANDITNPAAPFSVEAWIQPGWDPNGPDKATRVIIASLSQTGGFALMINDDNNWQAQFNMGAAGPVLVVGGPVDPSQATHVVLTFDGNNAAIFTNGMPNTSMPVPGTFERNLTSQLVIGAGGGFLPPRQSMADQVAFPCFPFQGVIQDVAIYKTALDSGTIFTHFTNGTGYPTDT